MENEEVTRKDLVVGTTVPAFKALSGEDLLWLTQANSLAKNSMQFCGFDNVYFFAAIETDARGLEPFGNLLNRLEEVGNSDGNVHSAYWTFSLDDESEKIEPINRLIRICTGRNLVQEYALRNKAVTHILHLDADLLVPNDSVVKLMELDKPVVGGDVPSYCLGGPDIHDYPFPVQQHWNTAGFLLVDRLVARKVKWRHDVHDSGNSDDPCFAQDIIDRGFPPMLVRKDVIGKHAPLKALHLRGHDLEIRR